MRRIGIIILAAGGSPRLGELAQSLEFDGISLIRHVAEIALNSVGRPVVVVTGSRHAEVELKLQDAPVILAHNEDWESGLGTSIRVGLEALANCENLGMPKTDGVLIAMCDQPFITVGILNSLVEAFTEPGREVVASGCQGNAGVPALFARTMYPQLMALAPNEGAEKVIEQNKERVVTIDFPESLAGVESESTGEKNLSARNRMDKSRDSQFDAV